MATQKTSDEASSALPDLAPDADHFAVLGLPRRFDLTGAEISVAYRAMARRTHPDRFGGASAETIARATQLSAEVNEAYRTLSDTVTRAAYLLTLAGGAAADEVREVPGSVLAEIMMLREQLEADKASGDRKAMRQHRATLERQRAATLDRIAAFADNITDADIDDKKALRIELNIIKYYDNILRELAEDPLASKND